MAIAFDNSQGLFDNANTASVFTIPAYTVTGSNMLAVAAVYIDSHSSVHSQAVTYAGTPMTLQTSVATSTQFGNWIYTMTNPPTGINSLVGYIDKAVVGGTSHQYAIIIGTYSGCNQSGQPDSSNSKVLLGDGTTNFNIATTVVASNCWLVGSAESPQGTIGGGSAGSGTRYIGSVATAKVYGNMWLADSNGTVGTGSQSLNWGKSSTSDDLTGGIVSIAPVQAATAGSPEFLEILGAGI